jgi:hypothetical protein
MATNVVRRSNHPAAVNKTYHAMGAIIRQNVYNNTSRSVSIYAQGPRSRQMQGLTVRSALAHQQLGSGSGVLRGTGLRTYKVSGKYSGRKGGGKFVVRHTGRDRSRYTRSQLKAGRAGLIQHLAADRRKLGFQNVYVRGRTVHFSGMRQRTSRQAAASRRNLQAARRARH